MLVKILDFDSVDEKSLHGCNLVFRGRPNRGSLSLYLRVRGGKIKKSGRQTISKWFKGLCAWCGHNYGCARLKGRRRSGAKLGQIIVCSVELEWGRMSKNCDKTQTVRGG